MRENERIEMAAELRLEVHRRLDNRLEGLPDDSPRGWELHRHRQAALEEALTGVDGLVVTSWGGARDEERTHELVELVLVVVGTSAVQAGLIPALRYVGDLLVQSALSEAVSEGVKTLFARLRPHQAREQIRDFTVRVDGVSIRCDPEGSDARITVSLHGGRTVTVQYGAGQEDIAALKAAAP